jgi:hypothetical protein
MLHPVYRVILRSLCLFGLALPGFACSSTDAGDPGPPHGAPGEIIDVDAGSIPLGEAGRASGGSAGLGGASGGNGGGEGGALGRAGSGGGGAGSSGASSLPPVHGVSAPCDGASDCDPSLLCHYDAQDYIAHEQCTLPCDSDDTCAAAFGSQSFCIGAQVCVHACKSDADCLARTHCNGAGWCERGGPGSGVPYCTGFPTPCGLLSGVQCISATGCSDDSECSGFATSCYSLFDSYSCSSQEGCFWSTYSKNCSGSAQSCSGMPGEYSCASQHGCFWSGGCTGTAKACEKQFVSLCTNQPGCQLETD